MKRSFDSSSIKSSDSKKAKTEKAPMEAAPGSSALQSAMKTSTYTITIGDQAENHVGMQKLGALSATGLNLSDLEAAQAWFESKGVRTTIVHLNENLEGVKGAEEAEQAYVFIAHGGLAALLGREKEERGVEASATDFFAEQMVLPKDTQARMYGRVVNKKARHNLCFATEAQEPDYESGKGRVVPFSTLPLLTKVRDILPEVFGGAEKCKDLVAEGNYYYDIKECGIGFHGDAERRIVIGVRVGATLPLHYQWFKSSQPVGKRAALSISHGDVYAMSEKAAGCDWKKKTIFTLRHAAGAKKFLTILKK